MTATIEPVAAPTVQAIRPEWVRMPRPGSVCPWTGLSRSYLYALQVEGKIRTVSLRKPGAARGCRLIYLASVLDYLEQASGGIA